MTQMDRDENLLFIGARNAGSILPRKLRRLQAALRSPELVEWAAAWVKKTNKIRDSGPLRSVKAL